MRFVTRGRVRSLPGWALPGAAIALGLFALLTVSGLAGASHELALARSHLETARSAIAGHDVPAATTALGQATNDLDHAGARARRLPLNLLSPVPLVGSPVKGLSAAVRAGREALAGGKLLNDAAASFPTSGSTGVDGHDLAGVHDASDRSTGALAQAGVHFAAARKALAGPAGALLPQVSGPARAMLVTVDRASKQLIAVEGGLRLLSVLSGPDTDLRLLLLSQDSNELRATGGFVGSFGIFHFAHGTVALERYDSFEALPDPEPPVEAPEGLIDSIARPWDLSNSNWWPDFPTSARTAIDMYARQGGGKVDGVVAITDDVMARLVGAVGPVTLPGYATPVVEAGFAERVIYEVELKRPFDDPRKKFLIELSDEVFHRLFSLPAAKLPVVAQALGEAGATGALQLYFSDPALQAGVAGTVVDGALPPPAGDFLELVDSNMTASKANAGLVRTITYGIRKGKDGHPLATLDIAYASNDAASIVNPYYNGYLRIYVPHGTTLADTSDGDIEPAADGPYDVIATQVYVEPLGKQTVHLEYILPAAVAPGGDYHLIWLRQPGTPFDSLSATIGKRTFRADPAQRRLTVTARL